jgi:hypothetical protein
MRSRTWIAGGVRVRFPLRPAGLARTDLTDPNSTGPGFKKCSTARFKSLRELSSERLGDISPHRHGAVVLSPRA